MIAFVGDEVERLSRERSTDAARSVEIAHILFVRDLESANAML